VIAGNGAPHEAIHAPPLPAHLFRECFKRGEQFNEAI
jgi:hypothetical protein